MRIASSGRRTALAALALAASAAAARPADEPPFKIADMSVKGRIDGENIEFTVAFTVETRRRNCEVPLVTGDMVLVEAAEPRNEKLYDIRYEPRETSYSITFRRGGARAVKATFACRPRVLEDGQWREAVFAIPAANMRELEIACDRPDLDIVFPGAMRLDRKVDDDRLVATALLGPGRPFAVRWKPEVRKLEAKLVMSSDANAIVTAGTGALRVDTFFLFSIAQGALKELAFSVPKALSVTQVRGMFIQDWHIDEPAEGAGARTLAVTLTRPQEKEYALQVNSEMVVPVFPARIDLPVIDPREVIRAGGHLAVGTDSAIRLVVEEPLGLSQMDAAGFPRIVLDREHPRVLPRSNAFFYSYATSPYRMTLGLDDIVPSFDADWRIVASVREEDTVVDATLTVDVRDAPIRGLTVTVDRAFVVANVAGAAVVDHTVKEPAGEGEAKEIEIHFRQPVSGKALVSLRLELGEEPIEKQQRIAAISVPGAKSERGYVVVAADSGVQLDEPATDMRRVHTGSVPMSIPGAAFAYRFREKGWTLGMLAHRRAPGIEANMFHLLTLGEGMAYGMVAVTYLIKDAPVDELRFRIPGVLRNVEFVGGDVLHPSNEGDRWKLKLTRKVLGNYELMITYNQYYGPGTDILAGGVECDGEQVRTQTGFITIASNHSLELVHKEAPSGDARPAERDEVPADYRRVVNAPMLESYKYNSAPHRVLLEVRPYERGELVPAVIEFMKIETAVSARDDGPTGTETVIRYRIKNASSQFLALAVPETMKVWSAHIVGARDELIRASTSYDEKARQYKIMLERPANPDEPITVQVKLGEELDELAWGGMLRLRAPGSTMRSTFARWEVKVPDGWVAYPAEGGNMPAEPGRDAGRRGEPVAEPQGLSAVMANIGNAWHDALGAVMSMTWTKVVGLAAVAALLAVAVLHRAAFPDAALAVALAAALLIGIGAASNRHIHTGVEPAGKLRTVSYGQVLRLDEKTPPEVCARIVPAWRRHAGVLGGFIVPAAGLVLLVVAVLARRHRRVLPALGAAMIVTGLAEFPALWPAMGHVFTWGVPAAILLAVYGRGLVRRMRRAPAAAAILAVGLSLTSGCVEPVTVYPGAVPVVRKVQYALKAEKDSMAIGVHLAMKLDKPVRFPLMPRSAILLTPDNKLPGRVRIEEEDGMYYLVIERTGRIGVDLDFLAPLAEAGADGIRSFRLAVPGSLANRVTLEIPGLDLDVQAPTAVQLGSREKDGSTVATAVFGARAHDESLRPDDIVFLWRPRARQVKLEKTAFFVEATSVVRFDSGLAECRHRLRFQIAQGELKTVRVGVPKGMTVTAVEGRDLGTWRFDPAAGELEARLAGPASGEYELAVVTQVSGEGLPYTARIGSLRVLDAVRQRGTVGLATSGAVFIDVGEHPSAMNVDDFVRDAARLLAEIPDVGPAGIRHAYRYQSLEEIVEARVNEVRPEIRSAEVATFDVADDKLTYGGTFTVDVAKAGVFTVSLSIPEGYDIDNLSAPEVSHWDDRIEGGRRIVQVHFKNKLLGASAMKLALSQTVSALPEIIEVPTARVEGALKHAGRITVSSDRGVRLSVETKQGVSDLDPKELDIRQPGVMAYKLLRPDWSLRFAPEVIKSRSVVDFVHEAYVGEGLVRHSIQMKYRLHNAGSKIFEIQVPASSRKPDIYGAYIARVDEVEKGSGRWRLELSSKQDESYRLTVGYETRFDLARGEVALLPARALDADLQRGYVVVRAAPKVELLAPAEAPPALQPADARSIGGDDFSIRDISTAAFCYSTPTAEYDLVLRATSHGTAHLLEAEVQKVSVVSVATGRGESMTHVTMDLRVGGLRYLEVGLPPGWDVWALLVDNAKVVPSRRKTSGTDELLLIPLKQPASGEMPVNVDFVYVAPASPTWSRRAPRFEGPRFNLPLKNITWQIYLPEGFDYDDFEGTLTVDRGTVERLVYGHYTEHQYAAASRELVTRNVAASEQMNDLGKAIVEKGDQQMAKHYFSNAYQLSPGNEDARVQLHRVSKDQALGSLLAGRKRLGPQSGLEAQAKPAEQVLTQQQIEREQSRLGREDQDNLDAIAEQITTLQERAAGANWPLRVNVPPQGRLVGFGLDVQVKPMSEMFIKFTATPRETVPSPRNWLWAACLLAGILALIQAATFVAARWQGIRAAFRPSPRTLTSPREEAIDDAFDFGDEAEGNFDDLAGDKPDGGAEA